MCLWCCFTPICAYYSVSKQKQASTCCAPPLHSHASLVSPPPLFGHMCYSKSKRIYEENTTGRLCSSHFKGTVAWEGFLSFSVPTCFDRPFPPPPTSKSWCRNRAIYDNLGFSVWRFTFRISTSFMEYNLAALWVPARETGEGWPLLTVDTEVNGDSKSTNKRGPFLVGSLGLSCLCTIFCLGCSGWPSKIFLSTPYTISIPLSPIAQQVGKAVVLGRLSLSMCLWIQH